MKLCGYDVGLDRPLFLIAGPCVVESRQLQIDVAGELKEICARSRHPVHLQVVVRQGQPQLGARRFAVPAWTRGCASSPRCKRRSACPVLTDVHAEDEIAAAAAVVDVLQTPAFLCRQTDFIQAVARAGKPVNIKKGQFLAPEDMRQVVAKAKAASGADNILVCERGASFGYHNLVSDMRSLAIMRETGCPVVFDATHSVQLPGGQGTSSRRPARIRAGAGARRGRGGRGRRVHGDASGSGEGAVRRTQRVAAGADARVARNAEGARRGGEARGLSRERNDGGVAVNGAADRPPRHRPIHLQGT